jgi:hypothetical protein
MMFCNKTDGNLCKGNYQLTKELNVFGDVPPNCSVHYSECAAGLVNDNFNFFNPKRVSIFVDGQCFCFMQEPMKLNRTDYETEAQPEKLKDFERIASCYCSKTKRQYLLHGL